MARLFTVRVSVCESTDLTRQGHSHTAYECEFGGLHFSRTHLADVKFWVRVAARHMYGTDTQVIFLTESKG